MGHIASSRAEEFEAVALPHLNALFRMAANLLGNRTKAEDVLQDVYLRVWKCFDRFEPDTDCRAWLFTILWNSVRNYRRKRFRFRMISVGEEFFDQQVAAVPSTPETLTDQQVLSAVGSIPPYFRAVVLLADIEEFSYKEISTILNLPVATVMSRLSRGRALLRIRLAHCVLSNQERGSQETVKLGWREPVANR